jgi:hypothetical protein
MLKEDKVLQKKNIIILQKIQNLHKLTNCDLEERFPNRTDSFFSSEKSCVLDTVCCAKN